MILGPFKKEGAPSGRVGFVLVFAYITAHSECKCHLNVYQTLQAEGGVRSIIMRLIIKQSLEAEYLG